MEWRLALLPVSGVAVATWFLVGTSACGTTVGDACAPQMHPMAPWFLALAAAAAVSILLGSWLGAAASGAVALSLAIVWFWGAGLWGLAPAALSLAAAFLLWRKRAAPAPVP